MSAPDIVAAALAVAAGGWPVFPCGPDKKPLTEHGFKDASTDPATIRCAFRIPSTRMIGVPTGGASGFDVLDLDPRHGSDAWRAEHINFLPHTRVHQTAGGGEHWLFANADGLRNSAGKIAPGLDVRAKGGYIIVPPSPGYIVVNQAELAPWPVRLLAKLLREPELKAVRSAAIPQQPTDQLGVRYRRFVEKLLSNLRAATDGTKHQALLKQSRTLGGVADACGITDADAVRWLLAALPDGVRDWAAANRTALDGLQDGRRNPLQLEDRPWPRT